MGFTIDLYIPKVKRRSELGKFLTTLKGLRASARNPVPARPRVREHDQAIPAIRTPNQYKGAFLERYEEPCDCDECTAKRTRDAFEEGKHPRDNTGEFTKGGGGSPTKKLQSNRTLMGDPWKRGELAVAIVNPTPDQMSKLLDDQAEEETPAIRVVSYGDDIAVANGYKAIHADIMALMNDHLEGALERDDSMDIDWVISTKTRGATPYSLQGTKVRVTAYVEADGYESGKATNIPADEWPEGLRRAFGMASTKTKDADFKEGEHPRGQPKNKGQFSKGKSSGTKKPVQTPEEQASSAAYLERMRGLPDQDGPHHARIRALLDTLTKQYPLAGHVRISYENYGPDSLARAGGNSDYGLSISLNPDIIGDPAAMAKYEKDWEGLVVGNNLEGIVSHEFGHALSHIVQDKIGDKRFWQIFKDVYGGDGRVDLSDVTNALNAPSAYGQENAFELMAESFNAQYYNKHVWSNPDFLKKEGADPVGKAKELWNHWLQEVGNTKDYLPIQVPEHLVGRRVGAKDAEWQLERSQYYAPVLTEVQPGTQAFEQVFAHALAFPERYETLPEQWLPTEDAFEESEHPRGQTENAGQFAEKAGAKPSKTAALVRAKPDRSDLPEHIKKLVLPPAWTDVHYNPDPLADLLAVGRDAKGRRQPVYSAAFMKQGSQAKFGRVRQLEDLFTELTEKNESNRKSKLPIVRDTADVTKLIMETGIRPGSDEDTKAKVKAYGATTLLGQHVQADASGVTLDYIGKDGVHLTIPVPDKPTADMLRKRARTAGPDGKLFPETNAKRLQGYVKQLSGGVTKPKDFRTYVANSTALGVINTLPAPENEAAYKKAVVEVAKRVSKKLGNTPAVSLASYINPVVFADWRAACCSDSPPDRSTK